MKYTKNQIEHALQSRGIYNYVIYEDSQTFCLITDYVKKENGKLTNLTKEKPVKNLFN